MKWEPPYPQTQTFKAAEEAEYDDPSMPLDYVHSLIPHFPTSGNVPNARTRTGEWTLPEDRDSGSQ